VSKLGIVSPSVPDGPKIFIGGLPHHLTDPHGFGAYSSIWAGFRAFHLVKADPTAVRVTALLNIPILL